MNEINIKKQLITCLKMNFSFNLLKKTFQFLLRKSVFLEKKSIFLGLETVYNRRSFLAQKTVHSVVLYPVNDFLKSSNHA
jgi:hypothetical protein